MPPQTAAVSARSMSRHFIKSHMCWVHECLAVTCHLLFWHNDRDLSRVTAVTRGWNGYKRRRRKSAQKVDPGENFLPQLLLGLEPATFRSRVPRYNPFVSAGCACQQSHLSQRRQRHALSSSATGVRPADFPVSTDSLCTATAATMVWNSGSAVISLSRAGAPGVNTGL